MSLLTATNISHSFEYELFSDVNFNLNPKESKAILGRSGSGKSTLLHIFSTFIRPNRGDVELFNRDIYSLDIEEIERIRRFDLGIIFQAHYLFKGMSGMENIEVATTLSEREIDGSLIEKLQIDSVINSKIGELSGGQQQRVSIARVLSKRPKIIFADEPTGNLDRDTAELVMRVIIDYIESSGAGLILVTHDECIANMCDSRYRLKGNRLV
ncbi:MAG: ATP-binding cassette domain-containing protein [Epsilonproteobacteria bacterium]|nr:ATP-binding cassette domain-containing protein [Campylobacterota bacterium]